MHRVVQNDSEMKGYEGLGRSLSHSNKSYCFTEERYSSPEDYWHSRKTSKGKFVGHQSQYL